MRQPVDVQELRSRVRSDVEIGVVVQAGAIITLRPVTRRDHLLHVSRLVKNYRSRKLLCQKLICVIVSVIPHALGCSARRVPPRMSVFTNCKKKLWHYARQHASMASSFPNLVAQVEVPLAEGEALENAW